MRLVYGPVLSWRFGRSLGIDPISGKKVCTYDCIYCQLGRTLHQVAGPEEANIAVDVNRLVKELARKLEEVPLGQIDVVTFSGSGEPTLAKNLEEACKAVKGVVGRAKNVVLLTNSSLLHRREVRSALRCFDVVCAKLDACDQRTYLAINRPHPRLPKFEKVAKSIKEFRKEFGGKLMVQTMLVKGKVSNCSLDYVRKLVELTASIDPDVVQLCVPYRPVAEGFIEVPSMEELRKIADAYGEMFSRNNLWVFGEHDAKMRVARKRAKNLVEEIVELIERRPCTAEEIAKALNVKMKDAAEALRGLEKGGVLSSVNIRGRKFYTIARP